MISRVLNDDEKRIINNIANNIISKNLCFFIGAGFSREFGYPGWGELLNKIIDDNKLRDKLSKTQLFPFLPGNSLQETEINKMILNQLIGVDYLKLAAYVDYLLRNESGKSIHSEIIELIKLYENKPKAREKVNLFIEFFLKYRNNLRDIITTNYDTNVEYCMENKVSVVSRNLNSINDIKYDNKLYKIHGCVNDDDKEGLGGTNIIITEKDYNNFQLKNKYLFYKTYSIFTEKKIVFIGYSINDPNIRSLLNDVIEESKGKIAFQLYWINKVRVSDLDRQYYEKEYNIKIIDELDLCDFFKELDERIGKNYEYQNQSNNSILTDAIMFEHKYNDVILRDRIINEQKATGVLDYLYNKIVTNIGSIECNLLVEPYLLLLIDYVKKDSKIYGEFSIKTLNILKIESYIVLRICRLIIGDDNIKKFVESSGLIKEFIITLFDYSYSGSLPFGHYADCLEYLLKFYEMYSDIFDNLGELFIKALYRLTSISGEYGDSGYDFNGINVINNSINILPEKYIKLLLEKYKNSYLFGVQLKQVQAIIQRSSLTQDEKGKSMYLIIQRLRIYRRIDNIMSEKFSQLFKGKVDFYVDERLNEYTNSKSNCKYKYDSYYSEEDDVTEYKLIQIDKDTILINFSQIYDYNRQRCVLMRDKEMITEIDFDNWDNTKEKVSESIYGKLEILVNNIVKSAEV